MSGNLLGTRAATDFECHRGGRPVPRKFLQRTETFRLALAYSVLTVSLGIDADADADADAELRRVCPVLRTP